MGAARDLSAHPAPGTGKRDRVLFPVLKISHERTECFLWFLPRLISLTVMAEENPQPENTGEQPSPAPQQQTAQQPRAPQGQNSSGQRRNDRHGNSRHHDSRQDHYRRDHQQSPVPKAPEKPFVTTVKDEDLDDEEETEQDRSSPQGRHRYRGGRPPKKIIEEWANDPYCE